MWEYTMLEARTVELPKGKHGAGLEVRYRLFRTEGGVPESVTVGEKKKVLKDDYKVGDKVDMGPNEAKKGFFNDRYRLVADGPLPGDFRLEIEQEYTANGEAVRGRNKVVYTPDAVLLYISEGGRFRLRASGKGRP